jgi:hypothetical protein
MRGHATTSCKWQGNCVSGGAVVAAVAAEDYYYYKYSNTQQSNQWGREG